MYAATSPTMAALAAVLHLTIAIMSVVIIATHQQTWALARRAVWAMVAAASMLICTSIAITKLVPEPSLFSYQLVQWQDLWLAVAMLCLTVNTYMGARDRQARRRQIELELASDGEGS
jgi:hypothetical protein